MPDHDMSAHVLEIRRRLLAMSAVVEERVRWVVEAIEKNDFDRARRTRHGDREVDLMELDIEHQCIEGLALFSPVAGDLRFIVATLRLNSELERTADLAKGIAKRLLHLEELGFVTLPEPLGRMAAAVGRQFTDTLDALAKSDPEGARRVRRGDESIDELQRVVLDWTQHRIAEDPGGAGEAMIDVITIARALERVGDICTNIAEDVVYLVEGDLIRHSRG